MSVHDGVIKWKQFPRCWPFVRGIHRSMVNSPQKGQWRLAFTISLICAWINGWVNNREADDLRRHSAHYDVVVRIQGPMVTFLCYAIFSHYRLRKQRVINHMHPLAFLSDCKWICAWSTLDTSALVQKYHQYSRRCPTEYMVLHTSFTKKMLHSQQLKFETEMYFVITREGLTQTMCVTSLSAIAPIMHTAR